MTSFPPNTKSRAVRSPLQARRPAGLALLLALAACQTATAPTAPPAASPSVSKLDQYIAQNARAAEESRNYQVAAGQLAILHEDNPGDATVTLGLARNLRTLGRTEDALKALDDTLRHTGPQAPLLAERGKVLLAGGQAERALAPLREAAGLAPGDWQVANALGIAHDRLERFDEAETAYRQALALSPDNPEVLNNLGLSRALAGDLPAGLALLRQAAAAPGLPPGLRDNVRENLRLLEGLKAGRKAGS